MTASRGTAAWRSASSRTRQEIEAAGASGVDGFLEAAPFVVAEQRRAVLLGDLLEDVRAAARRAALGHGPVPGDEVTLRVIVAAEEDASAAGAALDDAAAAAVTGAVEPHFPQLDVLALRIIGAGGEFAEAAVLHGERLGALRAFFRPDPVRLLWGPDLSFPVPR